jgi:anti-sigma B factor antagonist
MSIGWSRRTRLVLDQRGASDSAGIGMLVGKYLTVKRRGGTMKLVHLTDRTSRLLNITKLASVFEVYDREEQALQSFGVTV